MVVAGAVAIAYIVPETAAGIATAITVRAIACAAVADLIITRKSLARLGSRVYACSVDSMTPLFQNEKPSPSDVGDAVAACWQALKGETSPKPKSKPKPRK